MKLKLITYLIVISGLISCQQQAPDVDAVARVNDKYLSKEELNALYVNLKKDLVGGFADTNYWSSTEFDNVYNGFAWYQNFSNGSQDYVDKFLAFYVRAIRAF